MIKRAIVIVQEHLKALGHFQGRADGELDAATHAAVKKGLAARQTDLPAGALDWPEQRRLVAMLQLICEDKKIDVVEIDGFWGPVTQNAYESLVHLIDTGELPDPWREEGTSEANPHDWPRDTGAQKAMRDFYGTPGSPPIKQVRCPWTLRLAWNKSQKVNNIGCHAKVADSVADVLAKVHRHYGDAELKRLRLDLYGGCFAKRKKRGGSNWSTHAWAVAIDWDPERNQLKWGRDRASLDDSAYDFWWKAWEAQGWVSLGRARNFDWMHVQAARL